MRARDVHAIEMFGLSKNAGSRLACLPKILLGVEDTRLSELSLQKIVFAVDFL